MGAMTALCIANRRPRVGHVIGFSIKTYWPPTHLAGLQRQAEREPVVARRDVAVGRYLKLAGLDRLVSPDDPVTLDGLGHNPHVEDPAAVVGLLRL
jgi:hypothetical protein